MYRAGARWPDDIKQLYNEAARCHSAEAYTAASILCRKALMVCAVAEGDGEGKSFQAYVDFISKNLLPIPKAKPTIDVLRGIGNDANHHVAFVSAEDATRSMSITKYMLDAIYSLPGA